MSSADFNHLVLRKAVFVDPVTKGYIPDGHVFTVGDRGLDAWTNDLNLAQVSVSSISVASTLSIGNGMTTNYATVNTVGIIPSVQASTVAIQTTLSSSTIITNTLSVSSIACVSMSGVTGQFASSVTTNESVSGILNVSTLYGSTLTANNVTIASTLTVGGQISTGAIGALNVYASTLSSLSSVAIGTTLFVPVIALSTMTGSSANMITFNAQSSISIGSTITVPAIQVSTLVGSIQFASIIGSSMVTNSTLIHSTLTVETTLSAPVAQLSIIANSTLTTTNALVQSSLLVNSSIGAPQATITSVSGSFLTMENSNIQSTLIVGSTLTMNYAKYSTTIGSTLTTAIANVMSTLTVGSFVAGPSARLSTLNGSTISTDSITIVSSMMVPSANISTVFASTLSATTANVLSSVMIGSTLFTPSILVSTLIGSTLTATFATVFSTSVIGSTLSVPFIQLSTLFGSTLTTANTNVSMLLAVGQSLTVPAIQTSSLIGSTITTINEVITSTLIVGSTLAVPSATFSSIGVSTLLANTASVTSTFTIGSTFAAQNTTSVFVSVSSMKNFQGAPFFGISKTGFVCSNLPITFDTMTAMIDRTTSKIMFSFVNSISTIYTTEYYAYNGTSYASGYEINPVGIPSSLSNLKFPISTGYSLTTVGAWCSATINDMTSFMGSWTINAMCLRTGTYGDDLYSIELIRPINVPSVTSVPNVPTNVLTGLYPVGNPYGIAFSFTPPVTTGGNLTGYEVFATSNGGSSYISQVGLTSPIVLTGLTPGINYTLTVKAKNQKGQSVAASTSPSAIVYKTLPSAPTAISGALYPAGNATGINVSFAYPTNTGGGVDLYYATAMDTASTQITAISSNALSPVYLSAGLVPGTTYQFSAYSQNAGGTCSASTSVANLLYQIPPPTAPAIASLALTPAGNPTGIAVGFTPPPNTGGGIVDYITNLYTNGTGTGTSASTIGTTSPITVTTGLVAGSTFSFRVAGRNTGGTGLLSAYSSIVYKTLPTAPTLTGLSLFPAGNPIGIQVLLNPPSNLGGGVDTYTASAYYGSTFTASAVSTTSTIIVSSLTAGVFYTFNTVATNAGGTSVISNTSTTQYKTKPDPPTSVTGALEPVGAATGINVSFVYPINTGGVVDQYFASAMDIASTASTVTAQLSTSPIYLTAGLIAGTTYKFAVYSQNTGGTSLASTSVTNLLFQTVPGAPTGTTTLLTPVGNPTGVTVGFTAPSNTGGGVSYYTAIAYSSVVAMASTIGVSSPLVVQTLTPGTAYNFVVKATNTAGTGVGSASSLITYKTLPSVPTNVSGALQPSGAASGINVSFTYPTDLGGGVDLYYALAYDTANTASTVLVANATSPVYIPSTAGLIAGTTYKFGVYAKNAGGTTASTLSASTLFFQVPATAPLSLTTTLTPAGNPYGITASFLPPAYTGGGVSYYTISMYNGTSVVDTKQGSALSYLFSTPSTSITPGTSYNFYANAVNTGGSGASSITSAIVYKTLPGPPTNVAGALSPVGAGTGISITFSYPANLGGGVDLYYAMAIDALTSASTVLSTFATSPIFINTAMGLVPGTTYKFAVFSKNAGGSSASTLSGSNLFYQTLPTAPTITLASLDPAANPTGVMVSFTAPTNTFGGITNYQVVAYTGTTTITSSIGASSPIKVSTLTAGTSYNYTVAAINNAGIGVSSSYTTLTYYTVPSTVTGVSFALYPAGNPTGVNVSFTTSGIYTGGGGTMTYTARAYTGLTVIGTGTNTASPVYVTGLTGGSTYNFTVTAANAAVTGVSTTSIAYTYIGNPSAPQSLTSSVGYLVGSGKATITWAAPSYYGGGAATIANYRLTTTGYDSGLLASNVYSNTTTNVLANGTQYTFTVTVYNNAGLSASATTTATPYYLPYAPSITGVSRGIRALTISWNAPSNNGKTITNYRITQSGGATYYVGNQLSYTATGLSNYTSYTYTVAASNDSTYYGSDSGGVAQTTYSPPSVPTSISAARTGSYTQLQLSWSYPSFDDGYPVTSYWVSSDGTNYSAQSTPYTFNLSVNTWYNLYVYAVNAVGTGPVGYVYYPTYRVPFSLNMTTSNVKGYSFTLNWSADGDGLPITKYRYIFNNGGWVDAGTTTSVNITNLSINTTYYNCYVEATNAIGTTTSGAFSFATAASDVPPTPTINLNAYASYRRDYGDAWDVNWDIHQPQANPQITSFNVLVESTRGGGVWWTRDNRSYSYAAGNIGTTSLSGWHNQLDGTWRATITTYNSLGSTSVTVYDGA